MKPRLPTDWRHVLLILVALLLFAAGVQWLAGWGAVLDAARRLPPSGAAFLLGGLAASYLLRGMRLYLYFRPELAGRFPATLRLTLIHNAMVNLLPMRAGELSFPLLANREFGLPIARTVAALVWFRLLDLMLLTGIAWAMLAAPSSGVTGSMSMSIPAWLPAACLPIVVLAVSRQRLLRLARHLPSRAAKLLTQAADGLPVSHSAALRDLAITAANWGTKLLALAATFLSLTDTSSWAAGVAAIAGEVSGILPVAAPAGLGTYEAAVVAAAAPFGIATAVSLRAAVVLHVLILAGSLAGLAIGAALPRNARGMAPVASTISH